MLVFPVFKQAGEIIEVRVFPGFYSRLVTPAMAMAKLVVVVVRVTVRMIVRVTMRVLFSRGMLVWFSPVPVDVNRAAHGERKSTPERALFQVKRIVCLCELPTLIELIGLKPPRGKPGGQEGYLKEEESGASHCERANWIQFPSGSVRNSSVARELATTVIARK